MQVCPSLTNEAREHLELLNIETRVDDIGITSYIDGPRRLSLRSRPDSTYTLDRRHGQLCRDSRASRTISRYRPSIDTILYTWSFDDVDVRRLFHGRQPAVFLEHAPPGIFSRVCLGYCRSSEGKARA